MAKVLQTALASAFKTTTYLVTDCLVTGGKCVTNKIFYKNPKIVAFLELFAYYAGHLPENWLVLVKLHFYVNTFHVRSGLGGMNFVWPKECGMQSEFPWLQLTVAPMQHGVRVMCPGPGTSGPWSSSLSPASLFLSMMAADENASLEMLFGRLIAMEAHQ